MPDEVLGDATNGTGDPSASDLDILNTALDDKPEDDPDDKEDKEESPSSESDEEISDEGSDDDEETEPEGDDEEEEETEPEETDEDQPIETKSLIESLKKVDPDILKKVPNLRKVIYENHEYGKVFPTAKEAQEASERLVAMDNISESLLNGDPTRLFGSLVNTDRDAYTRLVQNILPTVYKHDKPLYARITTPIVKGLLNSALAEAATLEGDAGKQLAAAAKILSKRIFGSYEPPKDPPRNEVAEEKQKLERERAAFHNARASEFENNTHRAGLSRLESIVTKSLESYEIPSFTREALIEKIIKETNKILGKDERHSRMMDSLWQKSKGRFSEEDRSQIISAYLGRAKTIMPAIRQKLLREALGSKIAGKKRPDADSTNSGGKHRKFTPDRRNEKQSTRKDPPKRGESDLDAMNRMLGK